MGALSHLVVGLEVVGGIAVVGQAALEVLKGRLGKLIDVLGVERRPHKLDPAPNIMVRLVVDSRAVMVQDGVVLRRAGGDGGDPSVEPGVVGGGEVLTHLEAHFERRAFPEDSREVGQQELRAASNRSK